MTKRFSVVGKRVPLINAIDCVTGRAKYAIDIQLPGMLYAGILRSPYPHARVVKIDTSRAERLEGVRAVLTIDDVPRERFNPSVESAITAPFNEDTYIFDEKVRYVGDEVAAVAADSEEIANAAVKLIDVKYEILPAVFDPLEAMKPEAPQLHYEYNRNLAAVANFEHGDVEKEFKDSDIIVEREYRTSRQQHASMEPQASVAWVEGERVTLWASTQCPFVLRKLLSKILGISESKIRVVKPFVGGAFGAKLDLSKEELICILLSKKADRPVKYVYERDENFYATRTRHPSIIKLKMGARRDGTITAVQAEFHLNTGAYASHGPGVMWAFIAYFTALYRFSAIKFAGYTVYTNTPISGACRGYGNPQASFAREIMLDEIAEKLKIDPIELRLRNITRVGDIPPVWKLPVKSSGLEECIRIGMEKIGWKKRTTPKAQSNLTKMRGIGMACNLHGSGVKPAEAEMSSAIVKLNEDGSVILLTGASDVGQGLNTVLAQIVAEELGVQFKDIHVVAADTDTTPFDSGCYASRSAYVAGNAARKAAAIAKKKILEKASKTLTASTEDIEIEDGRIFLRSDPSKGIALKELLGNLQTAHEGATVILGEAVYEAELRPMPFGAQFVEVEVDTETGEVKVLKIVSIYDVGVALNPTIVEGQIEGGAVMGIGYALTEDLVVNKRTGEVLNPNFRYYKLLTSTDIPQIEGIFVESIEPTGPFGAKSIGESPIVSTAPAIANAIYNAVGLRMRELPITAEKVLEALENKP